MHLLLKGENETAISYMHPLFKAL